MIRSFKVLRVPNPLLKQVSQPVTFPLDSETIDDIYYLKTCFRKNFEKNKMVGLAAPQVGISKRFFIIAKKLSVTNNRNAVQSAMRQLDVYINP